MRTQLPSNEELTKLWPYLTLPERERLLSHLAAIAGARPDPIEWIEREFWIPELNGPIQLAPYQKRCLTEALGTDSRGLFRYSTIVWSDIKKSIKSTIAAAVAAWMCANTWYGQVISVANDLKQADSRVAYYYRRALELNKELGKRTKITPSGYKVQWDNHTLFEAVPIDPKGEAGGGADMIIYSELWGANSKAQQLMWSETTLSPLKFGRSFRWVESYAGYTGESPTLEMLYRTGKEEGRQLWPDLPVWVNDNARLFLLWNETPRLPWQTPEYYATEAATLLPAEFERLHRNRWVSSEAQFVPDAWWAACKSELPEIQDNECAVFALDAGVSNDCFAIVGVIRDPANPSGVVVRYARAWKPEGGQQLDFAEPEAEIRRIAGGHNVVEWAYDPYQLHSMCTRLGNEGVGWFREFKQGEDRTVADKQLFDLIRDRHIRHGGDPVLTQHIQNANAKNEGENKLRIVKRADHLKIDLAVALSMATAECLRLNL